MLAIQAVQHIDVGCGWAHAKTDIAPAVRIGRLSLAPSSCSCRATSISTRELAQSADSLPCMPNFFFHSYTETQLGLMWLVGDTATAEPTL